MCIDARPLNENEARVNFVLIETSLLSLIYATQDSRMTKKWHVRMGMHSLAQHFLVILPILSLPADLLCKVSNDAVVMLI